MIGESFRKVATSDVTHRRGLLGHASVLTASANGVETSPVVRGVWVLECLLGTPPTSPPPDVPPIEPDARGATTIREQLAKHRSLTACAGCHAKIDPWGFALEYFDPIGKLCCGKRDFSKSLSDELDRAEPVDVFASLFWAEELHEFTFAIS